MATEREINANLIAILKTINHSEDFSVASAFNDTFLDKDGKMVNQIVVSPPVLPSKKETFDNTFVTANGTVEINVFTLDNITNIELKRLVINKIETSDLAGDLIVSKIEIGSADSTSYEVGTGTVSISTVPINFDNYYKIGE